MHAARIIGFDAGLLRLLPKLQRRAFRLTGNAEAANDLVQDCVLRALQHAAQFQPGTNLGAWLFTILHNQHISNGRARQREVPADPGEFTLTAPPTQVSRVELTETVRAIQDLNEGDRTLLYCAVIDGCRYRDLALRMGVPIGTIRSRLARTRARLAGAPQPWR